MAHKRTALPIIVYTKRRRGGILVRPDSRQVVQKAVEGHPVDVFSVSDYLNLYCIFDRMLASNKRLSGLRMFRRQVGFSHFRLFVGTDESAIGKSDYDPGYTPKRGRYKHLAGRLAAGDAVSLGSKGEATKVVRAWQVYVPAGERPHLVACIKPRRGGRFVAVIKPRASVAAA